MYNNTFMQNTSNCISITKYFIFVSTMFSSVTSDQCHVHGTVELIRGDQEELSKIKTDTTNKPL